ncbi:Manganese superoxide dismutase [Globisporangium polare]
MALLRSTRGALRLGARPRLPRSCYAAAPVRAFTSEAATGTAAAPAEPALNFAFSGSGFLTSYHLGVAQGLDECGALTPESKVAGASGGSIAALTIAAKEVNVLEIHEEAKRMVELCRTGGTLWKLEARLRAIFDLKFGDVALEPLNERLTIVTQRVWPDRKIVHWNHFNTIEDVGIALVASCYIPFYLGRTGVTKIGDELHVDGGLVQLVPEIPGYVKVCAFHSHILRRPDYEISPSLVPDFPYNILQLGQASVVAPSEEMLDELFQLGKQSAFIWAESRKKEQSK